MRLRCGLTRKYPLISQCSNYFAFQEPQDHHSIYDVNRREINYGTRAFAQCHGDRCSVFICCAHAFSLVVSTRQRQYSVVRESTRNGDGISIPVFHCQFFLSIFALVLAASSKIALRALSRLFSGSTTTLSAVTNSKSDMPTKPKIWRR